MVSQSLTVGDLTRGLYLSEAREADSGFIAEAVTVSSSSDLAYHEPKRWLKTISLVIQRFGHGMETTVFWVSLRRDKGPKRPKS